jgi:hypothetical protein
LKNLIILLTLILTLSSCQENQKKADLENDSQTKNDSTELQKKFLVDYKIDTYKIYIGESYKISDNIIDWHWAALNDPDDKIDSTGKDAFLFLGEPLLKYNDDEYLPSLHIETDKNLIKKFSCSILFNLANTENAKIQFLRLLSKNIKQLKNDSLTKTLIENGSYEKETKDFIEIFRLTKGKELEYDKFEYTVKQK